MIWWMHLWERNPITPFNKDLTLPSNAKQNIINFKVFCVHVKLVFDHNMK